MGIVQETTGDGRRLRVTHVSHQQTVILARDGQAVTAGPADADALREAAARLDRFATEEGTGHERPNGHQ